MFVMFVFLLLEMILIGRFLFCTVSFLFLEREEERRKEKRERERKEKRKEKKLKKKIPLFSLSLLSISFLSLFPKTKEKIGESRKSLFIE